MHSITQVSCRFGLIVDLLGISPTAFHLILLSFKHITIILAAYAYVLLAFKLNPFYIYYILLLLLLLLLLDLENSSLVFLF